MKLGHALIHLSTQEEVGQVRQETWAYPLHNGIYAATQSTLGKFNIPFKWRKQIQQLTSFWIQEDLGTISK